MHNSRSRKLHGSLGDSWGDADYSDGDMSIHSASSLSDAGSKSEDNEENMTSPRPRVPSSRGYQPISTRIPADRPVSRVKNYPGTPRSPRSVPRRSLRPPQFITESQGLSFIMPSMPISVIDSHNDSLRQHSQLRTRNIRRSSRQSHAGSAQSSPRPTPRRTSAEVDYEALNCARRTRNIQGLGRYPQLLWANFIQPLGEYALDVIWYTMNSHLKPLFGAILTILILVFMIRYSSGLLHSYIETALMPVCTVPGSSYILPFCSTGNPSPTDTGQQPDFLELTKVQSTLGQVMEGNKYSYTLPGSLMRSELVLRDLRSMVKYSNLPSRKELEKELSSFIETASETSALLASYNSQLGHTVDLVISTNRGTIIILERIAAHDVCEGFISCALAQLNPFAAPHSSPSALEARTFEQYVRHVEKVKTHIEDLIEFSNELLYHLTELEKQLGVIADLAIRDDLVVTHDLDQLLSQIWTKLGRNLVIKKDHSRSLQLLKDLQSYRKDAAMNVRTTLLKLQGMAAELKNLRESMTSPEFAGHYSNLPLQDYIEVVEGSIRRLNEARGETQAMQDRAMRRGGSDDNRNKRLGLPGKKQMPTIYA